MPGSASGACWLVPCSPWPPPFAPPTPVPVARGRSPASQLLWRGLTSRPRASQASAHHLPDAGQALLGLAGGEISRFPRKELTHMLGSTTAPGRQALALARPPVLPSTQRTVSASRGCCFRGSIPSLCAPLSTLHQNPRGFQRMTRGQCGSLHLHWRRLALFTPCRSPGARIVNLSRGGMLPRSVAR